MVRGAGHGHADRVSSVLDITHVVCSDRFAGVERYITYVAPVLAARGHRVTVIGGETDRMRADLGADVRFVPARTPVDAARALLAHRPGRGLVHAHMTDAETVAVGLRPLTRAPVVATLHFAKPRGRRGVRRVVATAVARGLGAQIAVSRFVAERSQADGAVVILTGVPDHAASDRTRDPVVLVAQRLEPEKRGDLAILAWARSGLATLGWRLEIVGEGREQASLRVLSRHLGVEQSIEFAGSVTDLPDRMGRASIFLATTPIEAFGLSVVEAMCSSLPVIAADGGAHRETVGRAAPELLFPVDDADQAADLLRTLASDTDRRASIGAALRRSYESDFTIDAHVDQLEVVYRQALGPP